MVAMFDIMGRLYQIEAKALRGGNEFELTRFQQSLVFERGVTNRSPEEVRAIREACPSLAGVLNAVVAVYTNWYASVKTAVIKWIARHIFGDEVRGEVSANGMFSVATAILVAVGWIWTGRALMYLWNG